MRREHSKQRVYTNTVFVHLLPLANRSPCLSITLAIINTEIDLFFVLQGASKKARTARSAGALTRKARFVSRP
jgi:hypothetical protein